MKLTRKNALTLTRKLYKELAKTGDGEPEWAFNYTNSCPLCEYVQQSTKYNEVGFGSTIAGKICIKHCPIKWPSNNDGNCICHGPGGLWRQWKIARSKLLRKRLANQIATLPYKRKSRAKKV